MQNVDEYSQELLDKARRFYEKGKETNDPIGRSANFQAAIIFSIMTIETAVYSIADELCLKDGFSILEQSLLLEKDISFDNGSFKLSTKLKMSRLIDRIDLLINRFCDKTTENNSCWRSNLTEGIRIRNTLIHPKNSTDITVKVVENTILSVLGCIDVLYRGIYHAKCPYYNRELTSTYSF